MKTIHPGHLEHRFWIFGCQILCITDLAIMPHHQQTLPHPTIRRVRCQEIILSLALTHAVMAKLFQTFASRTQHNQEEVYLQKHQIQPIRSI